MTFLRSKHPIYSILVCTYLLLIIPSLYTQVVLPPQDIVDPILEPLPNEYFPRFDIPSDSPISILWHQSPNEIGRKIDLQEIQPDTKYLEDDTAYLEKIIDGVKGRLFLKEVIGYQYTVLDLHFVPYIDTSDSSGTLETEEIDTENSDSSDTLEKEETDTENSTPSGTPDEEETDTEDNIRVPTFEEKDTGRTIIIDIIQLLNPNDLKRKSLTRYDDTETLIYEEQYVYTKRGGIQRLTRNYSDGSIQRYIYYFSTGGLKEVLYQDPSGSYYLLSYTLRGGLEKKVLYNEYQILTYEEYRFYDTQNALEEKIIRDYITATITEEQYTKGNIIAKQVFILKDFELPSPPEVEEPEVDPNEENITDSQEAIPEENTPDSQEAISKENTSDSQETIPEENTTQDVTTTENTLPLAQNSEESLTNITFGERTIISQLPNIQDILSKRVLLYTETFKYNPEGETVETLQSNILHEVKQKIDEEGEEKIESTFKNETLVQETIQNGNEKIEVFYFQGQQILRVYYNKTKKIKEEIFVNGELVETRFENP